MTFEYLRIVLATEGVALLIAIIVAIVVGLGDRLLGFCSPATSVSQYFAPYALAFFTLRSNLEIADA